MELNIFSEQLKNKANQINIKLEDEQIKQFYKYMNLLLEWNEKVNLTAIVDPEEVILKHFIDSITIKKQINEKEKVIDVGTGAGFPGIPLSIIDDNINITLLDSLNKRVIFLEEAIKELELKNIKAIHGRVEEFAKNKNEREIYDIATSRAVAPLNILLEYLLPLVKIGGKCICMKGSNIEEIKDAKNALDILGGKIESIEEIILPGSDIKRNIIIVKKVKQTPLKYPRKAGTPSKEPL
ncbi:MAG: 16S rRNA (guanine(527)-N(7))-methyltransferase RsmG [Clostridiaceae bacterium]|nr:16S rRNA (guanine(527)-N(7))-methyltransferase RsmG [Clostridiaceae bacterium]